MEAAALVNQIFQGTQAASRQCRLNWKPVNKGCVAPGVEPEEPKPFRRPKEDPINEQNPRRGNHFYQKQYLPRSITNTTRKSN